MSSSCYLSNSISLGSLSCLPPQFGWFLNGSFFSKFEGVYLLACMFIEFLFRFGLYGYSWSLSKLSLKALALSCDCLSRIAWP